MQSHPLVDSLDPSNQGLTPRQTMPADAMVISDSFDAAFFSRTTGFQLLGGKQSFPLGYRPLVSEKIAVHPAPSPHFC